MRTSSVMYRAVSNAIEGPVYITEFVVIQYCFLFVAWPMMCMHIIGHFRAFDHISSSFVVFLMLYKCECFACWKRRDNSWLLGLPLFLNKGFQDIMTKLIVFCGWLFELNTVTQWETLLFWAYSYILLHLIALDRYVPIEGKEMCAALSTIHSSNILF